MKIIPELSEYIEEEIDDAKKYISKALEWKEKNRQLADVFYSLSLEEMRHMQILHGDVSRLIDESRKKDGDPPASMLAVYDYLHKRQIDRASEVKAMQTMYKEG